MTKYLINRILRSLVSVMIVVGIVMVLIYSALDRNLVFAADPNYNHVKSNGKEVYMMQQWEKYGYLDYVPYGDWLKGLLKSGESDQETYDVVSKFGNNAEACSDEAAVFVDRFTKDMEADGYKVIRLDAKMKGKTKKYADGGEPRLYAHKDIPLINRLWTYLTGLISVDNIHFVPEENDIGERGLTFTLYDPAYGGEKFSPAIMGNGTLHKYLLYFNDSFP